MTTPTKTTATITTPGGRILRLNYTVNWIDSLQKWVVGCGNFWSGERMTLYDARRECEKRNAKKG